ncbi:MAG: class III extradiol ring-cleavage dioxygenase [Gammaproteobacteria bacterium]
MKFPTLYIPHGGGPCFFMQWTMGPADTWDKMAGWLRGLGANIGDRPKALVVVSAHWEEAEFSVTESLRPPLLFDYYGFPAHTYRLTYPAAGDVELARRIRQLLDDAGMVTRGDTERGFDHGVFIPLKLIYPDADIPIVQLSLKTGLGPAEHIAAGRALEPLRNDGVLIIGSGMSYHNMRGFGSPSSTPLADEFDAALTELVCLPSWERRNAGLGAWTSLPHARHIHPREEHLLPLMVAAGAAGSDTGACVFSDHVMDVAVSACRFG